MKYKGLILDIDNTLYNYNIANNIAKKSIVDYCKSKFNIDSKSIIIAYDQARKKVHVELSETASSHNRLLYFQKMCEILNLNPLNYSFYMYQLYWDTFIHNMKPFNGVYKLLKKYKNNICLTTDLTADIQYKKIKKLKLHDYCNSIVTSEEAGKEKPHPYMFMLSLQKLGLKANEVCVIGDSFDKDIFGARNLEIDAIWLNQDNKDQIFNDSNITEVKNFDEILKIL
jgi:HAD superfamily hydrolase (TIGR01509 family)